ncbi:MAG: hypothetical protein HY298_24785 [Verrucomicrobia bacterium]|nr:hypothetical protein [Verrucomicrobiota bacterium]
MPPPVRIVFIIARCFAAALAFYATAQLPYNYYTFTRWMVFLVCCWALWICRRRLWPSFAPAYFAIGLLFNPVLSFHFPRSTWRALDIAAGVFLLLSLLLHRPFKDAA